VTNHRVTRLPKEIGVSGWEAISPREFPLRQLEGDVLADWLIIGAGFAGLSAARRLSQLRPGERIVILDAQEAAKGTAGRNSGFMIDVPHNLSSAEYSDGDEASTLLEIRQNRFAIGFAAAAAAEYGMPATTFDPAGKINAAATERGLKLNDKFKTSLGMIGEKYDLLDPNDMRDLTGSNYYLGGVYTPGAVIIQPADYIRRLAKGLSEKVSIFENSPVLELSSDSGIWVARSRRGTVKAAKVILGVNGHLQSFGHARGRLMHVYTYASMTAPFSSGDAGTGTTGRERWALLPADAMGATIRKITTDGLARIVIRTRYTYEPSISVPQKRLDKIVGDHRRSFNARFPLLSGIPFEYSWAGALCLSRNHVPVFGEIEEGLYSACCENGLGTVKSTLAGALVAELASGAENDLLKSFAKIPPPSRLPPEPIAWLGINSVIRWQEFRAGKEQ
jgi:glycine/D-amino acid oxidase-like deaminating enzyme